MNRVLYDFIVLSECAASKITERRLDIVFQQAHPPGHVTAHHYGSDHNECVRPISQCQL